MRNLRLSVLLVATALLYVQQTTAQIATVSVTGGQVQGVTTDGVTAFKGIPFAADGVVLVSIAYRTGVFGFLAGPDLSREQGGRVERTRHDVHRGGDFLAIMEL